MPDGFTDGIAVREPETLQRWCRHLEATIARSPQGAAEAKSLLAFLQGPVRQLYDTLTEAAAFTEILPADQAFIDACR